MRNVVVAREVYYLTDILPQFVTHPCNEDIVNIDHHVSEHSTVPISKTKFDAPRNFFIVCAESKSGHSHIRSCDRRSFVIANAV